MGFGLVHDRLRVSAIRQKGIHPLTGLKATDVSGWFWDTLGATRDSLVDPPAITRSFSLHLPSGTIPLYTVGMSISSSRIGPVGMNVVQPRLMSLTRALHPSRIRRLVRRSCSCSSARRNGRPLPSNPVAATTARQVTFATTPSRFSSATPLSSDPTTLDPTMRAMRPSSTMRRNSGVRPTEKRGMSRWMLVRGGCILPPYDEVCRQVGSSTAKEAGTGGGFGQLT